MRPRRPLRAEPDGDAAPGQPAHRAARLALRPVAPAPASSCASRTSTTGRVQTGSAERQLRDLRALGLDWDGEVVFQSDRHHAYEAALETCSRAAALYECFCTRAEIRAAASAPHGPLPEGAYPGTCLRLSEAEPAAQAGRRPRRRRSASAPAARRSAFMRPPARPAGRAWSTTSSCAATTARPPTTSRWSSTTPGRRSGRSCAATTCSTRRRASSSSAGCSGSPSRPTRTCRSCSGRTATGSPSATAPSPSTTTIRRGAPLDGGAARHARRRHRRPSCSRASIPPRCRERPRDGEA